MSRVWAQSHEWGACEKKCHAFSQHTVSTIGSGRCTETWHAILQGPMVVEILDGPHFAIPFPGCLKISH